MAVHTADAALIEPAAQPHWDAPHATWFTLMGVGGGIFLVSRLLGLATRLGVWLGLPVVDLLSFVVIAVGGLILISTLGRPFRFLRTVLRPGTSWISRGAVADFVFLVIGALLILPGLGVAGVRPFAWLPWDADATGALGRTLEVVALLAAAVVIFYAGQVLADSRAIGYWRSRAIPVQFTLSALVVSAALVMVLETANGVPIGGAQFAFVLACLVVLLAAIGWHLREDSTAPGKAESLQLLLRGRLRAPFLGIAVAAGTVLPILLAVAALGWPAARDALGVLILCCTLPAAFVLRLVTVRAGILAPVRATIRIKRPR